MLGDNPERTRNPLTRAIRRRNAKTVNFAPPTYYEPEEREWSDEEEEDHEGEDEPDGHGQNNAEEERQAQQSQQSQQVQQIHQPTDQQKAQPAAATIHRVGDNDDIDEDDEEPSSPIKPEASTPATLQTTSQDAVQRSRKGVVRNTDSFFRDDTVETKKISLTPRLLRGDGDSSAPAEQEVKQRASLDTFDRITADEKSKDGKRKEKKGMLSGLFKRKDKSGKASKSDTEDADRASEDSGRSPQSKDSVEGDVTPERKPGKLQKTPPSVVSPKQSPTETRAPQRDLASVTAQHQSLSASLDPSPAAPRSQTGTSHETEQSGNLGMTHQTPGRFPSLNEKRSVFAPITGALRSKNASQDMDDSTLKPIYSKRAKERFAIDDSDSEDDSTPTAHSSILHRSISPLDANDRNVGRPGSEQRVSPPDMQDRQSPPGLMQAPVPTEARPEAVRPTAAEMTPTSPSEQTASTSKHSPSVATHTPSTSRSTPTWSDASLRSYMDNDQDVRDLLVIVHDKTNVQPVGPDHPLMNGLFMSEKVKLADMQTQLDSMLMTWLAKKNRPGTTRA
ncbi:protein phosphatase regulator [Neophaeococcomyces mojaviensis]|uniref:Protein phosphatase regulator n=1 Tax=Neophaeococcomyces mojaviensis TaxID=3383035 RepID=A0ACC3AI01_9EURO|nr:protein phosphatase regulator [Knufia sp. JES_112]